jgi:hypothetical protein
MAEHLEIAFNAEALAAEGLQGFLQKVFDATGGNTQQMKVLFGRVEALTGALILGSDQSGKFADAMAAMQERTDAVANAFEKMSDNITLSNQKIVNSFTVTLITIGTPLLDEWADIAGAIANIFKGVKVSFDEGAFDGLLGFVEGLGKDLATELEGIAAALPEALQDVDFSEFTQALQDLVDTGIDLLDQLFGDLDLTNADDLKVAIQTIVDTLTNWVKFSEGLVEGIGPFIAKLADLASGFSGLEGDTVKSAGEFTGWGKAINTVAGIIPALTAPMNLLSGAVGLLGVTQIPAMVSGLGILGPAIGGVGAFLTPFVALVGALTLVGPENSLSRWLRENSELFNSMAGYIDETLLSFAGYTGKAADARIESANVNVELGKLIGKFADVTTAVEKVPDEMSLELRIDTELDDFFRDIDQITWNLENIDDYEISIPAEVDSVEKVESDWNTIKVLTEDGTEVQIRVDSAGAVASAKDANQKIDEALPDKLMEIQLQGEIDIELEKIKTQAEIIQTSFEWTAKVEIADIQAATEELIAIAELAGAAWKSTGDVITAALGALDTDLSAGRWHDVIKIIKREQDIREDLAEQLILLQAAQTALIEARTKALAEGKGIITITTDGIEPEIEQVLYSIVSKAQVKANEEGYNALLGI